MEISQCRSFSWLLIKISLLQLVTIAPSIWVYLFYDLLLSSCRYTMPCRLLFLRLNKLTSLLFLIQHVLQSFGHCMSICSSYKGAPNWTQIPKWEKNHFSWLADCTLANTIRCWPTLLQWLTTDLYLTFSPGFPGSFLQFSE